MGNLLEKLRSKDTCRIRNVLFDMAMTIEVLIVLMDKSDYIFPYPSQVFRITFLLTSIIVLLELPHFSKKELLVCFILCVIAAIGYRQTGRNELLRFLMFGIACKDLNVNDKLKIYFYEITAGCLGIMILSLLGIYGRMYNIDDGGVSRLCFGMGDSNAFHCMVLMEMALFIYLYDKRLKWYIYIALFMLNIIIYLATDCSTAMICASLLCIASAIVHLTKIGSKIYAYLLGIGVFVFDICFSIWSAAESKNTWGEWTLVDQIDKWLTGRIMNIYWGTQRHGGSLETWKMFSERDTEIYFDMGWIRLFYWYGWIPALIIVLLFLVLLTKAMRDKNSRLLVLLTVLGIYTIVEAHLVSVYIGRNFVLLILVGYLFNCRKGIIENEQQ